MSANPDIIYTKVDEAPELASGSFLSIIQAFASVAGVNVGTKDISLAGRIISQFPEELTDAQLQYCSNDVIYLHKIKNELYKMLVRENRLELYENSIKFLKTRIKLDQSGFTEDIFQH